MPDNFSPEFKNEIRKQTQQQVAKWVVVALIGSIVIAATGWWLYFEPKIKQYIKEAAGGIPTDAVVSFNRKNNLPCPDGWEPFSPAIARLIVGAGQPSDGNIPLSSRPAYEDDLTPGKIRSTGGSESYKLTIDQMPEHAHGLHYSLGEGPGAALHWYNNKNTNNRVASDKPHGAAPHPIEGGEKELNNMPPYISLYYCRKK